MLLAALGLRHVKFRIWERGRQHFPLGEPLKGPGYEPQEEALGAFPTNLNLEWDFHSRFSLIANFHCSHPLHFTFHLTTKAVGSFHTHGVQRDSNHEDREEINWRLYNLQCPSLAWRTQNGHEGCSRM